MHANRWSMGSLTYLCNASLNHAAGGDDGVRSTIEASIFVSIHRIYEELWLRSGDYAEPHLSPWWGQTIKVEWGWWMHEAGGWWC